MSLIRVVLVFLTCLIPLASCAADVNAQLIEAAKKGHTATVKALLAEGADVDTKTKDGSTALIWAAMHGHTDTVEALLKHGADVNHPNLNEGATSLMLASARRHTATVKVLFDHGANILGLYAQTSFANLITVADRGEEPCPILWNTPMGQFWGRTTDAGVLAFLTFEQLVLEVYQRREAVVLPGDTVLDVGAHLGVFSRLALNRGAVRIVAFEPEPVNAICYQRTFEREMKNGKVVLLEAAASDNAGVLHLAVNAENTAAHKIVDFEERTDPIEVPATTIDAAVQELDLQQVNFVKMDIEGYERVALLGARNGNLYLSPT